MRCFYHVEYKSASSGLTDRMNNNATNVMVHTCYTGANICNLFVSFVCVIIKSSSFGLIFAICAVRFCWSYLFIRLIGGVVPCLVLLLKGVIAGINVVTHMSVVCSSSSSMSSHIWRQCEYVPFSKSSHNGIWVWQNIHKSHQISSTL